MHLFMMSILLIASVVLTLAILLQESKSDGVSGAIAGGAEQLFGKKKSSGYEDMLSKITVVSSVIYLAATLVLVTVFN